LDWWVQNWHFESRKSQYIAMFDACIRVYYRYSSYQGWCNKKKIIIYHFGWETSSTNMRNQLLELIRWSAFSNNGIIVVIIIIV